MTAEEAEQHLEDIECDLRFLHRQDIPAPIDTAIWLALTKVEDARNVARKAGSSQPDE